GAGRGRGDGRERPAISAGRIGLQVPNVDMARPAAEDDIDPRFGPRWIAAARLVPQETGERDAGQTDPADAQELPAMQAAARFVPEREHGGGAPRGNGEQDRN